MAIQLKHKFVSAKVDTLDNSRVQPSNWNDTHDLLIGPAVVIGRGAGAGQAAAVEIPMGATGQDVLAAATPAAARAVLVADDSQTTIAAAAAKVTPVDADVVITLDSAAGNIFKRVTWANIKATLKAYFDTYYPLKTGGIFTGSVTAVQNFISSTAAIVLATTGAGTIYLRPNGAASAVGQGTMDAAGNVNLSGYINGSDVKKNGVSLLSGVGDGQTWQDVTAGKAVGGVYQNVSGRPIMVTIAGDRVRVQVSSNNVAYIGEFRTVGDSAWSTTSFVLPAGWYYKIQSAVVIGNVMELK